MPNPNHVTTQFPGPRTSAHCKATSPLTQSFFMGKSLLFDSNTGRKGYIGLTGCHQTTSGITRESGVRETDALPQRRQKAISSLNIITLVPKRNEVESVIGSQQTVVFSPVPHSSPHPLTPFYTPQYHLSAPRVHPRTPPPQSSSSHRRDTARTTD